MSISEIGCLVIISIWSLIVLIIAVIVIKGLWQNRKEKKKLKKKKG